MVMSEDPNRGRTRTLKGYAKDLGTPFRLCIVNAGALRLGTIPEDIEHRHSIEHESVNDALARFS